jgi:hypothetical protein
MTARRQWTTHLTESLMPSKLIILTKNSWTHKTKTKSKSRKKESLASSKSWQSLFFS